MEVKLYAYKCDTCGELHHPKHFVCRKCGDTSFSEVPLEGEGTVLTWTKVYNLPEGYMKAYLCFAIVKLDDTGLVVSGQIADDNPRIGERVKTDVGMIKEGVGSDYYGFIFQPID
jgi:uncharacterized OB-fold protein